MPENRKGSARYSFPLFCEPRVRGCDACVDMLSRSPMLDHDARLSMLKLGELIFRPDPEIIPKPPIKLAAIPGALTRPVHNTVADVPQHAGLPSVSNELSQPPQNPEQPAPPITDESAITLDVDDPKVQPRVKPQGAHLATYPSSSLTPLVVKKLLKRSSPPSQLHRRKRKKRLHLKHKLWEWVQKTCRHVAMSLRSLWGANCHISSEHALIQCETTHLGASHYVFSIILDSNFLLLDTSRRLLTPWTLNP